LTTMRGQRQQEWAELVARHRQLMAANPEMEFSKVQPELLNAVANDDISSLEEDENFFRLYPNNYTQRLELLMQFEKVHSDIKMRKFDQFGAKVERDETTDRGNMFKYTLLGLSRGHPRLIKGDLIVLSDGQAEPLRFTIEGIEGDVVRFSLIGACDRQIAGVPFHMAFVSSAIPTLWCSRNLSKLEGHKRIQLMLFKGLRYRASMGDNWEDLDQVQQVAKIDEERTRTDYVDGRLQSCNKPQRQAIKYIMAALCRPSLYILFGPPGTGKTATLIETAGQICQRDLSARVMICAQSNNCVDDLAARLLRINCVKTKEMIRLCSKRYHAELEEMKAKIPRCFTVDPELADAKRVVITTNLMAYKLKQPFDYVLMDEAGHATLTESLVPCSRVKDDGCFVLAGDPKQLGPVVQSIEAGKKGLHESLLDRMFSHHLYGRHGGKYDERFITKLVDSYRCDPRVLQLNIELFYKDELNCLGRTPPNLLKKLEFDRPIVFQRVLSEATRLEHNYSPSLQNLKEADACIEFLFRLYFMGIEPHQVGIIAYYALQKAMLVERFEHRLQELRSNLNKFRRNRKRTVKAGGKNGIIQEVGTFIKDKWLNFRGKTQANSFDWHCKIDTVDAFQGNERDIILISMTATRPPLGFVTDSRRCNVATSRARWLSVVFGHPAILDSCKFWKKYGQIAYLPAPINNRF
jgi:hypothetical protein